MGLTGEYAVASELCKRGYYAQLTLGNHKKTDLIVEYPLTESERRLFRVSVKSKTGRTWPKVTGIWEKGDLLVFVDFHKKPSDERPDFYVLNVTAWKEVVRALQKTKNNGAKIDTTNTLHWEGWYGCSVGVEDVKHCKDSWPNERLRARRHKSRQLD